MVNGETSAAASPADAVPPEPAQRRLQESNSLNAWARSGYNFSRNWINWARGWTKHGVIVAAQRARLPIIKRTPILRPRMLAVVEAGRWVGISLRHDGASTGIAGSRRSGFGATSKT